MSLIIGLSVIVSNAEGQHESRGQFRYRPTTIEKERPQLNEETRELIAEYRRNPSEKNYIALRKQVELNYDKVIARKKAKLNELKKTARHDSLVREMEQIVAEVVNERERRIEQSMRRFTDERLKPGIRRNKDGFLPVLGTKAKISIAYTPVTNAEYYEFIREVGYKMPKHWKGGVIPENQKEHPVVNISLKDAQLYCKWISKKRGGVYRLPTDEEWEYAAGHMPKDAEFNCGITNMTTQVTKYAFTLSACGAIDMWGNCWEWTVSKGKEGNFVKGGSFCSTRMSCRTENRDNMRRPDGSYEDVGFRIVREDK